MKQKIILLMVLIAGFTACSKDDGDDDVYAAYEPKADILMGIGEYEGEWVVSLLDKQVVDTAKLIVTNNSFQIRLPEEYLLINHRPIGSPLYAVDQYGNPVNLSDDPYETYSYYIEYKPSNLVLEYVNRGYSSDSKYVELSLNSNSYPSDENPVLGQIRYIDKYAMIGALIFKIGFSRDISGVAVYDQATGLWTIKLKLDIIAYDPIIANEELHFNPTELVYIAKKKI